MNEINDQELVNNKEHLLRRINLLTSILPEGNSVDKVWSEEQSIIDRSKSNFRDPQGKLILSSSKDSRAPQEHRAHLEPLQSKLDKYGLNSKVENGGSRGNWISLSISYAGADFIQKFNEAFVNIIKDNLGAAKELYAESGDDVRKLLIKCADSEAAVKIVSSSAKGLNEALLEAHGNIALINASGSSKLGKEIS